MGQVANNILVLVTVSLLSLKKRGISTHLGLVIRLPVRDICPDIPPKRTKVEG